MLFSPSSDIFFDNYEKTFEKVDEYIPVEP